MKKNSKQQVVTYLNHFSHLQSMSILGKLKHIQFSDCHTAEQVNNRDASMLHIQSFRCLFSHSDFRAAEQGRSRGGKKKRSRGGGLGEGEDEGVGEGTDLGGAPAGRRRG